MKSDLPRFRLISFVIFALLLASCGVQVQIVTPIPPTPTPRTWAFLQETDSYYSRTQANPRVTFSAGGKAEVGLFMEPTQQTLYVLQYKQVWLDAKYSVTWFDSAQSSARLRLSLYQRGDPDAAWVAYNSAEQELTTDAAPTTQSDSIGTGYYGETLGKVYLRVEIGLVAYPPAGEIINQASTNEFNVVVLKDPGEIEPNADSAKVVFGDLKVDQLFFDWRGWKGGPCGLIEEAGDDPARANIELACNSLNEGELMNAVNAMIVALGNGQNPMLLAHLADQLSLIAVSAGEFDKAAEVFEGAAQAWEITGDALGLSRALHNLATTYFITQDDRAWQTMSRLYELRAQFWDELGTRLTEANLAKFDNNADKLEELRWNFEGMEMDDYADVVDLWARAIRKQDESN